MSCHIFSGQEVIALSILVVNFIFISLRSDYLNVNINHINYTIQINSSSTIMPRILSIGSRFIIV